MANELKAKRPPVNVMKWAGEKNRKFQTVKVRRNELCPCGSGKKY